MTDLTAIHEAVALALRGPDPLEAARVLCRWTARALSADGAAISTMIDTRDRETVCASDQVAQGLEELQFTLGEGPCFEAFRADVPVLVPDLRGDTGDDSSAGSRWPFYVARAAEQSPARAVFVFPVSVGTLRIGTMSTYRITPGPLDTDTLAGGADLAEVAALVLLGLQDPAGGVAQLQREAATRRLGVRQGGHERVHLAAGMLAERLGLSPDAAFDRMRGHAFAEGRLLVDVAEDVVARRLCLDQPLRGPGAPG